MLMETYRFTHDTYKSYFKLLKDNPEMCFYSISQSHEQIRKSFKPKGYGKKISDEDENRLEKIERFTLAGSREPVSKYGCSQQKERKSIFNNGNHRLSFLLLASLTREYGF